MLFSFALAGTDALRLALLEDALRPLFYGLRRVGHRVIAFGQGFVPPPAINILAEHEAADLGRRVAQARQDVPGARIGIVCVDDMQGIQADVERWASLRSAAAAADFVWAADTTEPFAGFVAPHRLAVLDYGFDPVMLGRRLVVEPARRDVDLVVYGVKTPYRNDIAERLRTADLMPFIVEPGRFPDYLAADLLSRAKLVLVTRDGERQHAPSVPRLAKAICNGAAAIAEVQPPGSCALARYVTVCAPDAIADACRGLISEGRFVERGLAQLEQFRAETNMAANLAAPLAVAGAV